MISVVILGSGNVALHLAKAWQANQRVSVEAVWVRNPHKKADFENYTYKVFSELNALPTAEVYLLAVSDCAIAEVSRQVPTGAGLVVHTSGATDISALYPHMRSGVFYPLQSFSKKRVLLYSDIPVMLETAHERDREKLITLAEAFSGKYFWANSAERLHYHLAATIVNNFSNHFFALADRHLQTQGLDFKRLTPLIAETARKIDFLAPKEAQTGPAIRHDQITIDKHLQALSDPQLRELYRTLTDSIQRFYEEL